MPIRHQHIAHDNRYFKKTYHKVKKLAFGQKPLIFLVRLKLTSALSRAIINLNGHTNLISKLCKSREAGIDGFNAFNGNLLGSS